MIAGATNTYVAADPDLLFERLKKEYNSGADQIKEELSDLKKTKGDTKYNNIEGFENIVHKAESLISQARREILINTDLDISMLKNKLTEAVGRGVRIVVFSWARLPMDGLEIEYYTRDKIITEAAEKRFMIVTDFKTSLIASASGTYGIHSRSEDIEIADRYFTGTFTDNRLLAYIIAEHIHFDIYLLKLNEKYGYELIDDKIQIGSLMEKGFDNEDNLV